MENLVYLNRSDLTAVVRAEVQNALRALSPEKKQEKQRLTLDEAVLLCREKGYDISKSTLYKRTSDGVIPFMRAGGRKLVFDRQELEEWIEEKTRKII